MSSAYCAVKPRSSRLISVDILRGVAVLMVMLAHLPFSLRGFATAAPSGAEIYPGGVVPELASYGQYGVHLFLVISGFCIHMRWARGNNNNNTIDFVAFWKRRLARLYVPYVAVLAICLAMMFGLHSVVFAPGPGVAAKFGYDSLNLFIADIVLLLLLAQNLNGASQRVGNGPFWSLALEEQLYLLYFPLLYVRRRWGWHRVLALTAVVSLGWRLLGLLIWKEPPTAWFVVGPSFWFPWSLGALAVEAYLGHVRLPRWSYSWWTFAAVVGLAIWWHSPTSVGTARAGSKIFVDLLFASACFVVLTRLALAENKRTAIGSTGTLLNKLGKWSYSLYLVHAIVYVVTKQTAISLGAPAPLVLVLRVGAALALAYIFHRLVEIPFIEWSRSVKVSLVAKPVGGKANAGEGQLNSRC